jgi:hypothetical protein
MDNEGPDQAQAQAQFAQAFANMTQHGGVFAHHNAASLPAGILPTVQHTGIPPPPLGPYSASANTPTVYTHPQTQSASISRQTPVIVAGYNPTVQSTASFATVSPLGMNAATPGSSQTTPQGASTASTSARPPHYGEHPPSA